MSVINITVADHSREGVGEGDGLLIWEAGLLV